MFEKKNFHLVADSNGPQPIVPTESPSHRPDFFINVFPDILSNLLHSLCIICTTFCVTFGYFPVCVRNLL